MPGGELREPLHERDPDVAAEDHRVHRGGPQERRGERRGGRLALRAGDPDRGRRAQPEEQVRLGDEGRRGGVARPASGHQHPERVAEARFRRRVVRVDRRRRRHEVGVRPRSGRLDVRAEEQPDLAIAERRDRVAELGRRSTVVDGHAGTGIAEEAGERDPAARQTEDRHESPAERPAAHGVEGQGVGIDGASGRRHRRAHASRLIDERNRVTPSRPDRMATIQKRSVIFSSSHPPSSKWWWIGDIRKMRRPPVSLK